MEKDYKLIEDYLNGKLDQNQVALFEKRLNDDPAFAEAFQLEKSMNIFLVKENNKNQLLPQLESLGEKHFQTAKVKSLQSNRRWLYSGLAVAASIALLIFALNGFFQKSLYEQYANHQALNLIEKSEASPNAAQAQNEFNANDFQSAYKSLDLYLNQHPEDTKAFLAKGITALETGQYEEALSIFNQIHSENSALKTNGTWYLALTYLKQDKLENARTYLLLIPESENFLFKQAQELMQKL